MNLFVVLDIAIGLILIYLILSLLASQIQELIATILEWRAKHLKGAIVNLLSGKLTQDLYQHPLIKSLNQKGSSRKESAGPSYIPSQIFSSALLEIIQDKPFADKYQIDVNKLETVDEFVNKLEQSNLPKDLKYNLALLAKRAKAKVQDTQEQIQQLQQEIEVWFDSSMERASGVYTRNAKGVALLIALVITLLANADSVYIIKTLAKEETIRSTVTQIADQVVAPNSEALSCLQAAQNRGEAEVCTTDIRDEVNFILDDISPLPIGWNFAEPFEKQFSSFNIKTVTEAVIGWLLSAVAISMGAPFWFDLLGKVINVRNTGKKPRASTED